MCVCVCVCVYVCVLISHTILPDVTYFSPDDTYFLMVRATYYQEGAFLAGNFDVVRLSAIKIFIWPYSKSEKSHKNMHEGVKDHFCYINHSYII